MDDGCLPGSRGLGSEGRSYLAQSVTAIKGVGPKGEELLSSLGIATVGQLLFHLPMRYLDRSTIIPVASARPGVEGLFKGRLSSATIHLGRGRRRMRGSLLTDDTGSIRCLWFGGFVWGKNWLDDEEVLVWGKVATKGAPTIMHPQVERIRGEIEPLLPVYHLTAGLSQGRIRAWIRAALSVLPGDVRGAVPDDIAAKHRWPDLRKALHGVHYPSTYGSARLSADRIRVEALIPYQLLVLKRREELRESSSQPMRGGVPALRSFLHALPFSLTAAQSHALGEIRGDMANPYPMHRLLQGDVGSGKTVVAAGAMMVSLGHGHQAALMAPTEVLAEQHYRVIAPWMRAVGHEARLLTGSTRKSERKEILSAAASGEPNLVIGTQALIQEGVAFGDLALVVVDEQHRFGLAQRAQLAGKGLAPHVLIMTATPIPRSLALTAYGHLDLSVLDEMPPGRKPVHTIWLEAEDRKRALSMLCRAIDEGHQGYVVAPLVSESDQLEATGATELCQELSAGVLSHVDVGLLHGRMNGVDKERILYDFTAGKIKALVCTTVIEVGVDALGAGVVLIDGAERFGLAQLHQLRGRVGRAGQEALCILVTGKNPTEDAERRMEALLGTNDGFILADRDLELRGPGELLGPRQHGRIPGLLLTDPRLVVVARRCADQIMEDCRDDPTRATDLEALVATDLLGVLEAG